VSTVQAQKRVEEVQSSSEIGPALLAQIRADLEAAYLPPVAPGKEGEAAPDPFLSFDRKANLGDRDRLDFLIATPAYGPERDGEPPRFHGVNETGYQLLDSKEDPSVGVLYRREDFSVDADPLRGGFLTELYDRVKHFNVTFFDGKLWRNDWSAKREKNTLPRAVRVELRILVQDREERNAEQVYATTITFAR
jgi:hypothetical protein